MTPVECPERPRSAWQRNGSVLLWAPVLALVQILDLDQLLRVRGSGMLVFGLVLIVLIPAAALTAVLVGPSGPGGVRGIRWLAFGVLTLCTVATVAFGQTWLSTWILLALTAPSMLRGRWLLAAVPVLAAGSMAAAWLTGATPERIVLQGFMVLLALGANTAVVRLIETVDELRRTREELARRAVLEERERFSRDLHDLLGHSLSVMVVKAEAVRKLAVRDPAAAAEHAGDIERVGREALSQMRETVDGTRAPSLREELDGARRALDAAGIRAEVTVTADPIPPHVQSVLAWVVREGTTNVVRHSGARWCGIDLVADGQLTLTIADDGSPRPALDPSAPGSVAATDDADDGAAAPPRPGGLDGLRRRLAAVGGRLTARHEEHGNGGFVVTASIPREDR